jgi:tetratricopeptide (TPR) repeat protein
MTAAGVTPDYPRPPPPPRARQLLGALAPGVVALTLLTGASIALDLANQSVAPPEPADETLFLVTAAARGGSAGALSDLAWSRSSAGRTDEAIRLYRAALALDPYHAADAASLAIVLGNAGRCDEAHASLEEAERLVREEGSVVSEARRAAAWRSLRACPARVRQH